MDLMALLKFLDARVSETHNGFFLLQGTLTLTNEAIGDSFLSRYPDTEPHSLQDIARRITPQVVMWIDGLRGRLAPVPSPNIFICDWFNMTNFASKVVQLNDA
jgi:hypothetical protein